MDSSREIKRGTSCPSSYAIFRHIWAHWTGRNINPRMKFIY